MGYSDVRLESNRIPDVLAVSKKEKLLRATEVQSKTDHKEILEGRNLRVRDQLKQYDIEVKVKVKEIPTWDYHNKRPKYYGNGGTKQ